MVKNSDEFENGSIPRCTAAAARGGDFTLFTFFTDFPLTTRR